MIKTARKEEEIAHQSGKTARKEKKVARKSTPAHKVIKTARKEEEIAHESGKTPRKSTPRPKTNFKSYNLPLFRIHIHIHNIQSLKNTYETLTIF